MKKTFKLKDYEQLIDELEEKYDALFGSLKQLPVVSDEDSDVYAYGMRIEIPEYSISIRQGMVYDKFDESNCYDAFIVYDENVKEPTDFRDVYSNVYIEQIEDYYSPENSMKNPECYLDEDEFIFWD